MDAGPHDAAASDAKADDAGPHDAAVSDAQSDDAGANGLTNGAACGNGSQCQSGHCVDGVCCDIACDGTCRACVAAKTGYSDGVCAAIEIGTDPDTECADEGASSCGSTGAGCNGNAVTPACIQYPTTTTCATATCVDGMFTKARNCDGAGACAQKTTWSCGAYECNSAGTACLTSCQNNDECVEGRICDDGKCVFAQFPGRVAWTKTWLGTEETGEFSGLVGPIEVDPGSGRIAFGTECLHAPGLACDSVGSKGVNVFTADGEPEWHDILTYRATFEQRRPFVFDQTGGLVAGFNSDWSGGCCVGHLSSYDEEGGSRWVRNFGALGQPYNPFLNWMSVDGSGAIFAHFQVVVGTDFNGGGAIYGFQLVEFNAAGQFVSSQDWPVVHEMQSDSTGRLTVVATPGAAQALGCTSASGSGLWVAQVELSGTCNWSVNAGGGVSSKAYDIDADDNVIVAAVVAGNVNFGAGNVGQVSSDWDLVLAKLDSAGNELWVQRTAATGFKGSVGVSAAANGTILIGGQLNAGALDLGAGAVRPGAGRAYLGKFSAEGQLIGQHQFVANEFYFDADPSGDALVVLSGQSINLGDGVLFPDYSGVALSKIAWE